MQRRPSVRTATVGAALCLLVGAVAILLHAAPRPTTFFASTLQTRSITHGGIFASNAAQSAPVAPRRALTTKSQAEQKVFQAQGPAAWAAAQWSPWVARVMAAVGLLLSLRWLSAGHRPHRQLLDPLGSPSAVAMYTTSGLPTSLGFVRQTFLRGSVSVCWHEPAASKDNGAIQEQGSHVKECEDVTVAGGVVNVLLLIGKAVAGYVGHSSAMLADAAHTLGDLCGDVISYWVIRQARRPPDTSHPFGHGKFESIGAFSIAVLLLVTALETAQTSLTALLTVVAAGAGSSVVGPSPIAAVAALVSLLAKELLFHVTVLAGKRANSQSTVANAHHHRSDALTSLVALIGIGFAQLGWPIFDPIAGIIVSLFIGHAGWKIGLEAFHDLTDSAVDPVELGLCRCLDAAVPQLPGVLKYDSVRARKSGPFTAVSFHLYVEPAMPVATAHDVQNRIRELLAQIEGVRDISIAMLPATTTTSGDVAH